MSPGEALRALLDAHAYEGRHAARLLGTSDPGLQPEEQRMLWQSRAARASASASATTRRSAPGSEHDRAALAVLLRLFLLMERVPAEVVRRALPASELATWRSLGFLARRGTSFVGTVQISLHQGLRVVSDRDPEAGAKARADVVFGPTGATMVLDQLTPREPVDRALDLGCGTGYLALRLAAHAREVVATDVAPRAVDFTALNADLNGCPQVLPIVSDRFSALPGQRFDLITGNLPFVISPERRFVYRDGGEGFVPGLLADIAGHLTTQGWAFLLAQWPMRPGEEPDAELAAWLTGSGCDALVLCSEREAPDRYAARWSAGPAPRDRRERSQRFARWLAHYEAEGIEGLATGLLVLRPTRARSTSRPRLFCEDAFDLPSWNGAQVKARLRAVLGDAGRTTSGRRRDPAREKPSARRR